MFYNTADKREIEMRVGKALEASGITLNDEDTMTKFIIELIDIASDVGYSKVNSRLKDACSRAGMRSVFPW